MKLKSALLSAAFIVAVSVSAADAAPKRVYVNVAPPAPVVEEMSPRDGYVWAPGRHVWSPRQQAYVWREGTWLKARPGYVWLPERWEESNRGWYVVPGEWARRDPFPENERVQIISDGYKHDYRVSEYTDYDFVKKQGRGKRVQDRPVHHHN